MHWTIAGARVEDPAILQIDEAWDAFVADMTEEEERKQIRRHLKGTPATVFHLSFGTSRTPQAPAQRRSIEAA